MPAAPRLFRGDDYRTPRPLGESLQHVGLPPMNEWASRTTITPPAGAVLLARLLRGLRGEDRASSISRTLRGRPTRRAQFYSILDSAQDLARLAQATPDDLAGLNGA
jgi:hypothetical protein